MLSIDYSCNDEKVDVPMLPLVCIVRMLIKKDLYRISCGDPSYPLLELLPLLLFTKRLRPVSVIFGRRLEEII